MVRTRRSTGRSIASLFLLWVTMVAIVIYQMPVFAGAAQAMPMATPAAASVVAPPCDEMGMVTDEGRTGTAATPDAGMPCCDTSSPDTGKGGQACPLMGGCFSMCVSIAPLIARAQVTERLVERLGFADDAGVHHSVPPLQRPPRHL